MHTKGKRLKINRNQLLNILKNKVDYLDLDSLSNDELKELYFEINKEKTEEGEILVKKDDFPDIKKHLEPTDKVTIIDEKKKFNVESEVKENLNPKISKKELIEMIIELNNKNLQK